MYGGGVWAMDWKQKAVAAVARAVPPTVSPFPPAHALLQSQLAELGVPPGQEITVARGWPAVEVDGVRFVWVDGAACLYKECPVCGRGGRSDPIRDQTHLGRLLEEGFYLHEHEYMT